MQGLFFTGCDTIETNTAHHVVEVIREEDILRDPETYDDVHGCDDEHHLVKKPLLDPDSYVTDLGDAAEVVEATLLDRATSAGAGNRLEALATVPLAFRAVLPEDHVEGQAIRVQGPLGMVQVTPPSGVQPGMHVTFQLAPPPRFRVQVPPCMEPGSFIKYRTSEGDLIEICIPEGLSVGESFHVSSPSLMVRVPEGAVPGETTVVFRCEEGAVANRWLSAKVPVAKKPGDYFAAALPIPQQLPPPSDSADGILTSWFWGMSGL